MTGDTPQMSLTQHFFGGKRPKAAASSSSLSDDGGGLSFVRGLPELWGYNWSSKASAITYSRDVQAEVRGMTFRGVDSNTGLVLVGIFCTAKDVARRNLIRATTMQLAPSGVTVRFVICYGYSLVLDTTLWIEQQMHGDLYLLDCKENLNDGKTFVYFQSVTRSYPNYQFYAKSDTDSFVLYPLLAQALDAAPHCALYFGSDYADWALKNKRPHSYHHGSLYALSRDLVYLLRDCTTECPDFIGGEDETMARLLIRLAKDRLQIGDVKDNAILYFHKHSRLTDIHPWTIWVHFLKSDEQWWRVHKHVTRTTTVESIRAARSHNYLHSNGSRSWLPDENCTLPRLA